MNTSIKRQPWVNVAIYGTASDGQSLEAVLRSQGFAARIYNDRWLQLCLFLCPPHSAFRVQTHADDFKRATEFLNQMPDAPIILQKALHCPDCGSLRVQYPQMTRKFFLPTVLLHLGIIFRLVEHEAYCESCHCLWNLSPAGSSQSTKRKPHKKFPLNEP
jgi:hypothetical protein